MAVKNIIEVKGVSKYYLKHKALNNIDLNVKKGSVFGLLGPNGAGKTTLIRIINQILNADSGSIKINGELLNHNHIYSIGYLPEERGLYKKMKVGEQAIYLAQLKGLSKKDAKEKLDYWFEKFEIQSWWNKKIEDLSKGMAQKIQFIITILHEPKLLILDEPFSGLDPVNSQIIKEEILRLKNKETSIILSTHNMNSVEEICDEAAIIHKSNKILDGEVHLLKEKHQSKGWIIKYSGNQMSFTNAIWGGWKMINHSSINEKIHLAAIELTNDFTINKFIKGIVDHVEIIEINKKLPTMNDVFIKATLDE